MERPVRPAVVEAVVLCMRSDLSGAETDRLERLADALDLSPIDLTYEHPDVNLCSALAAHLGDEWNDAVAIVRDAQRTARGLLERRPSPLRSPGGLSVLSTLASSRAPLRVPSAAVPPAPEGHPYPLSAATDGTWRQWPLGAQRAALHEWADVAPNLVLSLYETDAAAKNIIDGATHALYAPQGTRGSLGEIQVPLIDYVRAAAALGAHDPLQLFLRVGLCMLQAYANRWASTVSTVASTPQLRALIQSGALPTVPDDPNLHDYVSPIDLSMRVSLPMRVAQWFAVAYGSIPGGVEPHAAVWSIFHDLYGWSSQLASRLPSVVDSTRTSSGGSYAREALAHTGQQLIPLNSATFYAAKRVAPSQTLQGQYMLRLDPQQSRALYTSIEWMTQRGQPLFPTDARMAYARISRPESWLQPLTTEQRDPYELAPTEQNQLSALLHTRQGAAQLVQYIDGWLIAAMPSGACLYASQLLSRWIHPHDLWTGLLYATVDEYGVTVRGQFDSQSIRDALSP